MQILERAEIGGVGVPRVNFWIAVGDGGPVYLHEARSGLDQSPCQEQPLAKRVASVTISDLRRFKREIERVAGASRRNEIEGLLVIRIERVTSHRLLHFGHGGFDLLQQTRAAIEAL